MSVTAGGDPGRDDYGLPPVDIEVPDDARELTRDVLAYRRELRSLRRRRLARRFYGPLTRDGMVLPLLAGCLALTLVAATLLTVFTARQPAVSLRPARPAHPATSNGSLVPARPAAALVDTVLFAAGQATQLNTLPGPVLVLALIPPRCNCLADLKKLSLAASKAGTLIYLVGVHHTPLKTLIAALGLRPTRGLEDLNDSLPTEYQVAMLTAVVVRADGSADPVILPDRGQGFPIEDGVRALNPASEAGPAGASPAAPGTGTASPAPVRTASAGAVASRAPTG
jgi:hypothetical protein